MPRDSESRLPTILLSGAAALLLLIGVVYLVARLHPSPSAAAAVPLPMGAAEQAYAQQIHLLEPRVGRAANFLNQEVTFVFGTVSNDGGRPIQQIEISLEFRDPFNQIVLRDTQRLFQPNAEPLAPGARRGFQLNYETLPATWNQSYPIVRITGLDLR